MITTNLKGGKRTTPDEDVSKESSVKTADSVNSKYYDDMPMELVEYLVKTDPRFAEKEKPRDSKNTYSKEKETSKRGASSSASPSPFFNDKSKAYIKKMPRKAILILSSVVFTLLIMFLLILNINANNKKFDNAITELENLKNLSSEFNELSKTNKALTEKVANLERKLEGSDTQGDVVDSSNTSDDPDDQPANAETLYIVEPGDNLSKISIKFYGNARRVNDIMNANGMTNPNALKVGAELKIPPQ